MSEIHEECGVIAIYHLPTGPESPLAPSQGREEVSRLAARMLLDLQNRGQLAAGVSTYNPRRKQLLATYKELGTVAEAFHQSHPDQYARLMGELAGRAAIGHVRYAAENQRDRNYAHPFERSHIKKNKWFSFAFNGSLCNYEVLKQQLLKDENYCFARDADSEVFLHFLCGAVKEHGSDLLRVCQETTRTFDGGYALVFLNALGEMFVARDPRGIKPMCYAFDGSLFAAASESVALFNLGFKSEDIKDVPPGNIVIVTPDKGVEIKEFADSPRTAFCFFEWVYFANAASVMEGKSVYLARKKLGEALARLETAPIDDNSIVVPVPDTSKAAADGMAYALGIPCLEGLMRNRYTGRTFIEGGETRKRKAETKYTPLPQVLEGKRVFLVDDSIVRSTTMRVLIERLREVGRAKEVHVRIPCPPIMGPCFYGSDMSTYSELFATSHMVRNYGLDGVNCCEDLTTKWTFTPEIAVEMAKELGCDTVRFLPMQDVSDAIGIEPLWLCRACVTHENPTEWGCKLSDGALEKFRNSLKVVQTK
ncbi:MAG: amidophosphoribosyltransferase [Thermoguttaceae bacterium]|nr:amidophosphoribosyltransferase [Thermoguttaceae bacterium]